MKTRLILIATVLLSINLFAQKNNDDEKVNDRIYFIVGVGSSYVPQKLYNMPAIDRSNNNVIIEKGQNVKTNLSLGIVYTPYFGDFPARDRSSIRVPHGFSLAAFFNPVNITKATSTQSLFDVVDVGFGAGWKSASNFLILGTIEFFGARQPRAWFLEKYRGNNSPFLINDAPQLSFDINDNDVFQTKIVTSIGIKFCYTFSVVNNFHYKDKN